MPWYILSNDVGTILAVYGAAFERVAHARARNMASASGNPVAVHYGWLSDRPQVGCSISMRGPITWFGADSSREESPS